MENCEIKIGKYTESIFETNKQQCDQIEVKEKVNRIRTTANAPVFHHQHHTHNNNKLQQNNWEVTFRNEPRKKIVQWKSSLVTDGDHKQTHATPKQRTKKKNHSLTTFSSCRSEPLEIAQIMDLSCMRTHFLRLWLCKNLVFFCVIVLFVLPARERSPRDV